MSVRSLPHFTHSAIGKTTHKRGFAYDHVNYITREDACSKILAGNMPASREDGARAYFEREAYKDGIAANARIADTFVIALPIELSKGQRHEAVASFMDKIGKGRIAWLAAFHDMDEDEHNPHCHLILRDADVETGRKVLGTTTSAKDVREAEEHGWKVPPRMTSKDLRVAWCDHLNGEMERHGHEARFDARTLKEQGIDREPQIHVGPQASAMAEKGKRFESQDRARGDHANVYTLLDVGSRSEHNERIKERNRDRAAGKIDKVATATGHEGVEKRALRERQSGERKALYAAQARDRAALRAAHDEQKLAHERAFRKQYAAGRQKAFKEMKVQFAADWKAVWKTRDEQQRSKAKANLKERQKAAYAGARTQQVELVKPVKDAAWKSLKASQEKERQDLKKRHLEETAALSRQHAAERNAVHEYWQQQHRQNQAARLSARQQNGPGMAATQAAAVVMAKQHAVQQRPDAKMGLQSPEHPVWQFRERARAAANSRTAIRYELDKMRSLNIARAGPRAQQRMARAHTVGQRFRARQEAKAPRARSSAQAGRSRPTSVPMSAPMCAPSSPPPTSSAAANGASGISGPSSSATMPSGPDGTVVEAGRDGSRRLAPAVHALRRTSARAGACAATSASTRTRFKARRSARRVQGRRQSNQRGARAAGAEAETTAGWP